MPPEWKATVTVHVIRSIMAVLLSGLMVQSTGCTAKPAAAPQSGTDEERVAPKTASAGQRTRKPE
ncbi:MAG TPA: hypothetical protein VK912_19465 [Longimicrobiales bacterium]|nr:hypothetical protein [Longimicrobiales bacterium]